ncbi:hypothetical protein GTP38_12495 [Duganella sp. FT94W]|uniref:Uncharacterized protein n=1 Tax=Duganella lactea TaxID=2692173 RepID=A0ABW9V652_9BURK|nr:hypothetical protein [Duganella lactea]MYM35149.1 hypothetical protein [Duganella lactea]
MASFRDTLAMLSARMDRFEERMHQDMREFKHDVGGVAAFNAALRSNMRTSFDSGKEAGQ